MVYRSVLLDNLYKTSVYFISFNCVSIHTAAARRQYETLKRQTQVGFKNSVTELLEGSERVRA